MRLPFIAQIGLAAGIGFAGVAAFASGHLADGALRVVSSAAGNPSCTIKGNISVATGERIYHVPGQKYYDETVINPRYGERWFCSEEEARAAGWRKARM